MISYLIHDKCGSIDDPAVLIEFYRRLALRTDFKPRLGIPKEPEIKMGNDVVNWVYEPPAVSLLE